MLQVTAGSRLHFGVFSLPPAEEAPPDRYFGGVGLMVEQPGLSVHVQPAERWSAAGPSAERALDVARLCAGLLGSNHAFNVTVVRSAPEHVGLGTGTQLSLATAHAVAIALGQKQLDVVDLARRIGRGRRSALGLHGFAQGGLLVEAGKKTADAISPLVFRADFPQAWSILLVLPREGAGLSGQREQEAFAHLAEVKPDERRTDALCRLVLLGLLPALMEHDLDGFGESLYEFNRRVGEMFAPWQGGVYANSRTAHLIETLRSHGVRGVGQSSWGPGVFAVVPTNEASSLADWLVRAKQVEASEVMVTQAANHGAEVTAT